MSIDAERLLGILKGFERPARRPTAYRVAFSGGLDSTVLLHALAITRDRHDVPISAVHVDHGLQPDSARWAAEARRVARSLGVDCEVVPVVVGKDGGPEAAARTARYAALEAQMRAGDWLLSAHHLDDQAETLLLNLLRGSGPEGLAAMPPLRPFGPGYLVRPLLDVRRNALEAYAAAFGLQWMDDPGNRNPAFDRNYLRHEILPKLTARWPDAARRLGQSAELLGECADRLRDIADQELAHIGAGPGRLPLASLTRLPPPAQARVLRRAIDLAGLPKPPTKCLRAILASMPNARADANPLVRWPGGECRRYRDSLYLRDPATQPSFAGRVLLPGQPVEAGKGFGTLALEPSPAGGIDPDLAGQGLCLRVREGGETIRPVGHAHRRKLKKLLQEHGVHPWMRDALPLLYAGEELVAVADLWIAAGTAATPGYAVHWHDAPVYA